MWITRLQPFYDIDRQWTQWEPKFNQLTPLWSNFLQGVGSGVELYQTKDEVILLAHLPGIDSNNIHIEVTPTSVTFRSEQQTQQIRGASRSLSYQHFQRTIPLPVPVEDDQVLIDNEQGALKITLLKAGKGYHSRRYESEHHYPWQNERPSVNQISHSISNQLQRQGWKLSRGWSKTKHWLGNQLHKVADTLLE